MPISFRLWLGLLLLARSAQPQPLPPKVDFLKDVQPVLTAKCAACHVGDSAQAGLLVHTRADLLRGGKTGPAIVPGKGAASLLVLKMEGKQGLRMPPSGPPLSDEAISRIRQWIDEGAAFDGTAPATPPATTLALRQPVLPAGTAAHPIDRFTDAYFARHGVQPGQPISDARFARRAWCDVTGLPPSPEELQAFEQDTAPDKRTRLIDRLLADRRRYSEHWISFWNDLLRNDEGVIYHGERKSITQWLLASLQQNLPYNEMVRSLLDPPEATGSEGFLVGVSWRGVVSASQTAPMQAAQNAAQVFLGINLKCAACHDSFINTWKLKDTYGLANMFSEEPLELVRCDIPLGKKAEAKFPYPELNVPFGETLASRRQAAADWFVHPENGRFARTLVNRYWKQLLGRGLVEPADDMDAAPWHADLLDWLASDFVAHGYNLQHLLKRILTSQAYQMAAVPETAAAQPYVFRGPRLRRLTAEQFGDAISAATGDWRVNNARTETFASYVREWRLKADSLSRALGRPIRDQVYTERSPEASTLQALELTNGPLLSKRLERGAKLLLGQLPPAPQNLFDSKLMRGGAVPIEIDLKDARELWLLIEDVDSYDPARVAAGWADAELIGPSGAVKLESLTANEPLQRSQFKTKESAVPVITAKIPSQLSWDIAGQGFTKFRAQAILDERSRQSDIGPAVRFFVFGEKPDPEQLIKIQGAPPSSPPKTAWTTAALVDRVYLSLLARVPTNGERAKAAEILGGASPSADGLEDLLWAVLVSPEFQYVQ